MMSDVFNDGEWTKDRSAHAESQFPLPHAVSVAAEASNRFVELRSNGHSESLSFYGNFAT